MSTRSPLPLFFHDRSTSPPTGLLSLHRVGSDRIESMHIPRATEREREDDSSFVRDPAARFFRTLWFLKPRHFLREGRAIAAEKERGEKKEWNAPPRLPSCTVSIIFVILGFRPNRIPRLPVFTRAPLVAFDFGVYQGRSSRLLPTLQRRRNSWIDRKYR